MKEGRAELIIDFYRRFIYRMEYMMKVGKDGTRVYARDYGKRCFCFWVDGRKKRKKNNVSKG